MRNVAFLAFAICSFGILSGCNTVGAPLISSKVNTFGARHGYRPYQGGAVTGGIRSANNRYCSGHRAQNVPISRVIKDDGPSSVATDTKTASDAIRRLLRTSSEARAGGAESLPWRQHFSNSRVPK